MKCHYHNLYLAIRRAWRRHKARSKSLVAERDALRQSAAEHKNAAAKALAENDMLAAERDRLRQALTSFLEENT